MKYLLLMKKCLITCEEDNYRTGDCYYDEFGARTLPSTFDPRFPLPGNPRLGGQQSPRRMGMSNFIPRPRGPFGRA